MSTARRLGVAAPFAGSPYRSARGQVDVTELAGIVARQEDHVTAQQLAGWIRDGRPRLRVIDVRSAAEFAAYRIPGAENIPIADIARAHFASDDLLVLYSEGGAHAAQAWVFLRALGLREVYFVSGGLQDWMDDVLHPRLAADASPAAQRAFEAQAELSRYFGGDPGLAETNTQIPRHDSVATQVSRTRRRGC